MTPTRPNNATLIGVLVGVILVLGVNWPVMAATVESISPTWMAVFRVSTAFGVVFAFALSTHNLRLPDRSELPLVVTVGMFRLALGFLLVFNALRLVPAGRSSVVLSTIALWTVPIAGMVLEEKVKRIEWIGLSVGLAGIVVLFEPWSFDWNGRAIWIGHGLLILAAIVNAATSVHIRKHRLNTLPIESLPWYFGCAGLLLFSFGALTEGFPSILWTPGLVMSVVYQGVLATSAGLWAQIVILRHLPAVTTNVALMAVPVVGLASSAVARQEKIGSFLLIGMALITVGVVIGALATLPQEQVR